MYITAMAIMNSTMASELDLIRNRTAGVERSSTQQYDFFRVKLLKIGQ